MHLDSEYGNAKPVPFVNHRGRGRGFSADQTPLGEALMTSTCCTLIRPVRASVRPTMQPTATLSMKPVPAFDLKLFIQGPPSAGGQSMDGNA